MKKRVVGSVKIIPNEQRNVSVSRSTWRSSSAPASAQPETNHATCYSRNRTGADLPIASMPLKSPTRQSEREHASRRDKPASNQPDNGAHRPRKERSDKGGR